MTLPLRDKLQRRLRAAVLLIVAFGFIVSSVEPAVATSNTQHKRTTGASKPARKASKHNKKSARKKKARPASQARSRRDTDPAKLVMPDTATDHPVLDVASQFLGLPYRFGAAEGAYDCSGFVRSVFAEVGVELPHSARDQFGHGDSVARDELLPGDLVFFRTYRRDASHVGIYCGNDKFIHATSAGGRVQVDSLSKPYYTARYLGGRRIDTRS